jgi:hypothetical protein
MSDICFKFHYSSLAALPPKMTRYHHSKRLEAVTKGRILEYLDPQQHCWKRSQMLSGKFWDFAQRCCRRIPCLLRCDTVSLNISRYFGGCWFRWPLELRRGFAAACLLELRVRVPPWAWISVSCVCCQLEISKMDRSLVQSSPTESACATECDRCSNNLYT